MGDLQLCLPSSVRLHSRSETRGGGGVESLLKCTHGMACPLPIDVDSESRAPTKVTPSAMTSMSFHLTSVHMYVQVCSHRGEYMHVQSVSK